MPPLATPLHINMVYTVTEQIYNNFCNLPTLLSSFEQCSSQLLGCSFFPSWRRLQPQPAAGGHVLKSAVRMSVMVVTTTYIISSNAKRSMCMTTPYHPEQSQLNTHLSHVIMKHVVFSHYQIIGLMVGEEAPGHIYFGLHYSGKQMCRAITSCNNFMVEEGVQEVNNNMVLSECDNSSY